MIYIEDKKKCCSCNACYNVCPRQAIDMIEDNEGFKYPIINREKCIKCGLCDKVCPILHKARREDKTDHPIVMAAWSKNNEIRLDSTSGGVFSELAKKVYSENGLVCGAVYNKEWKVEHIVSNTIEDLDEIRSSKYLQSEIGTVYKKIKENLEKNITVLMCGSPCQINGLYNFLDKNYENLITCDFICRGMNSPKIFKKYLNDLEEKYNSKISKIKFKNKTYGWHNFSTRIDFENGKKYIKGRYLDSYMIGYLKYTAFMRPSCYQCQFKDLPRVADITLADFWGIESIDSTLDNNTGTSLVLLNSKKGEEFFKSLSETIFFKEVKSEKVFKDNVCFSNSPEETEARKNVFKNIDKLNYKELSKQFFPEPSKPEKIKIQIRESKTFKKIKDILRPIYRKIRRKK